ncbi:heme ABC exporter ATP-binding protein CcmA [Moraxella nasovis]|uniref:heme ABC exporter ATP-binding protein CcmA n=1 Tax=Moraxella nasovis TaxID=2904121 RepID=UPI001F60F1E5|nr:heme ABC exporter ATP-binding protein CcmA [Moraxella nasovis]UNU73697.1 heme ABC exporter ATP-binding protein CcmA [Moraxella nasovis]
MTDFSHLNTTSPNCVFAMQGVDVQRGDFVLCSDVRLTLHAGDICHLIGENGLGKTTLLSQIAGILPMMTGKMMIAGDLAPVYVSHQLGISEHLTVAQNLQFLLSLYGVDGSKTVIEQALERVGLQGLEQMPSGQLSAGQSRRVGLARLFVLDVEQSPFWLLDEPLTALDVAMVADIEERIRQFASCGGAVLMTSHQLVRIHNCTLDLAEFAL